MIDLHAHILPGLDDGPEDMDESLEMCRIAERDGIHTIVATPHINPGYYEPSRDTILSRVDELNKILSRSFLFKPLPIAHRPLPVFSRLSRSSRFSRTNRPDRPDDQTDQTDQISRLSRSSRPSPLSPLSPLSRPSRPSRFIIKEIDEINQINQPNQINLKVLPGSDLHLDPLLGQRLGMGELLSINDNRRYIILELPDHFLLDPTREFIFDLKQRGITPIISHPERNLLIQSNIDMLYEFIELGALSQLTAMSITGGFGKKVKALAQTFLRLNLTHIIASDAHSSAQRQPVLSGAFKEASKIIGRENAWKMVSVTPLAIIEGKTIRY